MYVQGGIVFLGCFIACNKDHQSNLATSEKLRLPPHSSTTTTSPDSWGEKNTKGPCVRMTVASASLHDLVHQQQLLSPDDHQEVMGDTLQHMMEGISGARSTLAALGGCWPDGPSQCSSITSGGRRRLDKGCCCSYISPCTSGPRRCAAALLAIGCAHQHPVLSKVGVQAHYLRHELVFLGLPGPPWVSALLARVQTSRSRWSDL